mgnify:CR=1 FL=1
MSRNYASGKLEKKVIKIKELRIDEDLENLIVSFYLFKKKKYPKANDFYLKVSSGASRYLNTIKLDFDKKYFHAKFPKSKFSSLFEIEIIGIDEKYNIIYSSDPFRYEIDYQNSIIELIVSDFSNDINIEPNFENLMWYYKPISKNCIILYIN